MQTEIQDAVQGPPAPKEGLATIIYDGGCPACTGFSKLVRLLDVHRRARIIPAQDPHALDFLPGGTPEDLEKTFHFITPEGEVLVSGEALMGVLSLLPALTLVPLVIRGLPHHKVLSNRLYAWLARNRPWISLLVRA